MDSDRMVVVRRGNAHRFDVDDAVSVQEYLPAAADVGFSLARVRLDGRHPLRRNGRSTKVYFVLSGELVAEVAGWRHNLDAGDLMVVRAGEFHDLEGVAQMIVVSSPAFRAGDEVVMETR
jgi:mannose-6-phosphate isomerase-like protein (cupin superfamily)